MKEIFLRKSLVEGISYPSDMVVYIYLRVMMVNKKDTYVISLKQMIEELFQGKRIKDTIKEDLRESIKDICEVMNVKYESVGKDKWSMNLSNLYVDDKKMEFTLIYWEDVIKILNTKYQINKKMGLIYYYVRLIATTYSHVGKESLPILSSRTCLDERTINRYNKDLTGLGIIYKHDMRAAQCGDGKFKSMTNYYGLYQYKDKIIASANEALAKVKHVKTRPNANKIRSIKQRMKYGTSYDDLSFDDKRIIQEENAHKDDVISHLKDEVVKKNIEEAKVTIPTKIVEITENIEKKGNVRCMNMNKPKVILDFDEDNTCENTTNNRNAQKITQAMDKEFINLKMQEGLNASDIAEALNWYIDSHYTAEDIEEYLKTAS